MYLQGRLLIDPDQEPVPGWLRIAEGRIDEIGEGDPPSKAGSTDIDAVLHSKEGIVIGGADCILCPGFIDAHVHLPQMNAIGCDGLTLLDWLEQVIYPDESRWSEKECATTEAAEAYARLLRAGTVGFAGYLTSHAHGVTAAMKAAHRIPLRGIVGQTLMDREAPPELLGQLSARLARSEKGRLDTSLNPRFAVTCSDELLADTGKIFREGFPFSFKQRERGDMGTRLFLQTHLAESRQECDRVRELFPDDPYYAGVYDRHGLLTPHTLLAHGLHLSDAEWELIAERDSVVVHCPSANTFLRSGLFDFRKARECGVRVAVGSDIAAGCDLAMPRVARSMIEVAKLRKLAVDREAYVPTPAEAWTMITRGNAEALGFHDMGRLETGASADLLVLRVPFEIDAHLVGRMLHTWREDYIVQRVLRGIPMSVEPGNEES